LDRGASANYHGRFARIRDRNAPPLALLDMAMHHLNQDVPQTEEVACLLIQHGAQIPPAPQSTMYLSKACSVGSLPVLSYLLEHAADLRPPAGEHAIQAALDQVRYTAFPPYRGVIRDSQSQKIGRQMIRLLREHGAHLAPAQAVQIGDIAELKTSLEADVP